MDNPEEMPPYPGDVEREFAAKDQENQYLRGRNFGLQDAAESNFMPRNDPNIIEYKLSSEELLERIEHYLRGDILKTRVNEQGQAETFYSVPTKKISVGLYKNNKTKQIYIVDEHPEEKVEGEWNVISIFEKGEGSEFNESPVEDNYKPIILEEIKKGLQSKAKNPPISYIGMATREITDNSKMNLNEHGVQEIMNLLSMYINKETFLSWYKEERINEILADIGDAINKFLLINGKAMGLDSEYKKTKYPLIVITILHSIENAYRRALLGSENKGTREGILITQHQPQGNSYNSPLPPPKKKWSPFDKSTW